MLLGALLVRHAAAFTAAPAALAAPAAPGAFAAPAALAASPVATTPVATAGCPGLDALNPLCQAGSTVSGVAGSGIDAVLSGLSQWVASGAEWLLSQIGDVLTSTTTIDIGASWFHTHYVEMTALAGVVVLPLLLVSTMQAIYRQNPGQLVRAFLVQLPLALLLGVVAIQIVTLCLSATDTMCATVAGGSGSDVTALLNGVSSGLVGALGDPTMATFVLLLVGLMVAVAAFVLWLELLVRAAAVYVAVLFLPLALATLVWPSVSHWCRRLVETLAALILSKFVIVATLSLAASAISSGTAGTGGHGAGFASVLAGGALLVLSTFVPFTILRLIPVAEAGAIGHLEGARQRGLAPMTGVPRTAASYALREGISAARDARGAARLAAVTGPPGTGGAGGVGDVDDGGTGGASADGGGTGGGVGGGGDRGDAAARQGIDPDALTPESGGLVPDANGMAIGLAPSNPNWESEPVPAGARRRDKGPKPLLPVGGRGGGGDGGDGGARSGGWPNGGPTDPLSAASPHPVGRPGFNGVRHAFGQDHMGPVLTYIRPDDAPQRDDPPPVRTTT